jgi:hypothetical protein
MGEICLWVKRARLQPDLDVAVARTGHGDVPAVFGIWDAAGEQD